MFVSIEPPDQLRVLNATVGARRFVDTSETAPFEDRLNLHEYRYESTLYHVVHGDPTGRAH